MVARSGSVIQGSFRPGMPRFPAPAGPARSSSLPAAVPLPPHLASFGRGAGQPLPAVVQQKMEAAFGASFADVRVHQGPQAAAIGALAFAHGSDLYFAPGQYDVATARGLRLLGHELAHVVQQRQGRVRNPFGTGVAVVEDRTLEAEAERMGLRVTAPVRPPDRPLPASPQGGRPAAGAVQLRPVTLRDPEKKTARYQSFMADYERMQQCLTQPELFIPALKALNAEVEERISTHGPKRALSSVLLKREQQFGINSGGAPIYTSGLSGPDFNRMLAEAVIPKDVGELSRHGEQTHRIQWYIVLWHMSKGFATRDHGAAGFNNSPRDLLINSTKFQVPKANFPVPLARGANVWHALFDMATDVPFSDDYRSAEGWDWSGDVVTSADLLGAALHGEDSHLASRLLRADEGWGAAGRALREAAPVVSDLLKRNYNKRLAAEGTPNHLTAYHRRKVESGWYREPSWSAGGILVPSVPLVKHIARQAPAKRPAGFGAHYITYVEHLINDQRWDAEGSGFLGLTTKVPDGIASMRTAIRQGRSWDVFTIAEDKLRHPSGSRSAKVKTLYEMLAALWNAPWHTFSSGARALGRWDIGVSPSPYS